MTQKKLAAWVFTTALGAALVGLTLNAGMGFFALNRGIAIGCSQGALVLGIHYNNGVPAEGAFFEVEAMDSYSGITTFELIQFGEGYLAFQAPGWVWLSALALVGAWTACRAKRYKNADRAEDGHTSMRPC